MGLFFDRCFSQRWLKKASDKDLKEEYEKKRLVFLKKGGGVKTPEMKSIENEIVKRANDKAKKDPRRNTDPNYRWTDKNRWED